MKQKEETRMKNEKMKIEKGKKSRYLQAGSQRGC